MRKHLTIIKAFWQRALTYRFTIISYRIGEMGEMLVLILMWTAIYGGQKIIGGLTLNEMITYILVGNFINAATRNFLSDAVARDIRDGKLSMFLVKPMSYFEYILTKEIGRISLSTLLSVSSSLIIILFFTKVFIFNGSGAGILLILVMIILAFITELLLSYLIGLLSFWTDEVDGILSTIDRIKKFFSGGYFPLNLLPLIFVQISFALPFAYTFYIPAQLYLKKIPLTTGLWGLLAQLVWIGLFYGIIRVVWKQGLKKYEGVGI